MGTRMQSLFLYLWRVYTNILKHVVIFCRSVGFREFVKVTVNNHEYSCNLIVTRHSTTHVCTVRVKMRLCKLWSVIEEFTFQVKKFMQLPTHLCILLEREITSLKGTVSRDEYFLDQRFFTSVYPICAVAFNYTEVLHSVCGSVRSRENVLFQDHRWFQKTHIIVEIAIFRAYIKRALKRVSKRCTNTEIVSKLTEGANFQLSNCKASKRFWNDTPLIWKTVMKLLHLISSTFHLHRCRLV